MMDADHLSGAMGTGASARNRRAQFRSMTHHRKRAVTACEQCRARKAKCTNERPTCQSCIKLGTRCSYEQRSDHSSFDPASLLIIDKLNQVLSKLDSNRVETSTSLQAINSETQEASRCAAPPIEEEIYFTSPFASTDSVLSWPVFESELGHIHLNEESFIIDYQRTRVFDKNPQHVHRASICEDDIPVYIDRFIRFVHTKNPILDTDTLKQYATTIVENGLQWDAVSCLVLVACALGAIAAPFGAIDPGFDGRPDDASSLSNNAGARAIAENFYHLALRRLGLLDRSIIACQCQLLCGIYQMYTVRPIEGWTSFSRASITCALYLKGRDFLRRRAESTDEDDESFTSQSQSHQRLYWTCIKSECELRSELDLPVPELAMLHIPDTLPSPPTFSNPPNQTEVVSETPGLTPLSTSATTPAQTSTSHSTTHQQIEEQSWFYYLSELALLRIESRVSYHFYRESNSSWLHANIREMVSLAEDFELQLQNWMSMLPHSIGFRDLSAGESMNELQNVAHGRYTVVRGSLYRPFLYLMVHKTNMTAVEAEMIRPLAEKAIQLPMRLTSKGPLYHRHHGSWLACRAYVRGALILYAGIKAGLVEGGTLDEARRSLEACHLTLKYWQDESPDLGRASQLIEHIQSRIQ